MSGPIHPRVLRPVLTGGGSVWVSGVPPGATVEISDLITSIGSATADDPVVEVPVEPVASRVQAIVHHGGARASTEELWPLADPNAPGPYPHAAVRPVDYGTFTVPVHDLPGGHHGGYTAPLRGRAHLPANPGGDIPDRVRDVPLVLIAHGQWDSEQVDLDSHRGYDWLGEHLARWGMATCSIDLSTANRNVSRSGSQQYARAEIILMMLQCLLQDESLAPFVSGARIGLVGHSMGGEAAVVAQHLDRSRDGRTRIRGVASLAPTNYEPDVAATGAAYLQVHGSADYLLGGFGSLEDRPEFNGFRVFDRAWRPRSLAFVEGARHQPYNTVWFDDENFPDPGPDPDRVLAPGRQRAIGRSLVTALFADVLRGLEDYRGLLSGPMRSRGFADAVLHRQHQVADVAVVDDFGDALDQHLLAAEDPRDRTTNRRGQDVRAAGSGLDQWQDVHHDALAHGVHGTTSTDLAWSSSEMHVETGLGGIEVDPDGWLSLRVAQHYREVGDDPDTDPEPDDTWNDFGEERDLWVELDDGDRRAELRLGTVGAAPYPLVWGWEVHIVFVTVRLPIDAFLAVEPDLDISRLTTLRLRPATGGAGRVLVDDIEFETTLSTGWSRVSMLRVHDLGGGWGPATDHLDTEVVVQLDHRPRETFGVPLRADRDLPVARRMLDQLRGALATGTEVRLGYRWSGPTTRDLVRVTTRR